MPNSLDLMFGANQLMMQSIIAMKLKHSAPTSSCGRRCSRFRALDFLKVDAVLAETARMKDELKRAVADKLERVERRKT